MPSPKPVDASAHANTKLVVCKVSHLEDGLEPTLHRDYVKPTSAKVRLTEVEADSRAVPVQWRQFTAQEPAGLQEASVFGCKVGL